MSYVPIKRGTLLIPSGSSDDPERKHLFVILTDKDGDNCHLIVSISSIKSGRYYDKTTVLEPGCHPFVTKRSYVFYQKADIIRGEKLIKCVECWLYTPKDFVSAQVFAEICKGLCLSDDTPQRIINYFLKNK